MNLEYYLYKVIQEAGMFVVRTSISIYLIVSAISSFTTRPDEVSRNILYSAIMVTLIVASHYIGDRALKESIKGLVDKYREETQK